MAKHILITNDDGIHSPGLKAAAEAAAELGRVTIIAPSRQQTGAGRGLIGDLSSSFQPVDFQVSGKAVPAYHCDGSPALVVRHGLRTILAGDRPDLVVSGINYGENLGVNVTASGTVGAALEAACVGIPALAVSKQTDIASHHRYSDQDWLAAEHFLKSFSVIMLARKMLPDVDVLKIDVPDGASSSTGWRLTRLAPSAYYTRVIDEPQVTSRLDAGRTVIGFDPKKLAADSDIYTLAVDRLVSVTPLSVDLSSRVGLDVLQAWLAAAGHEAGEKSRAIQN